MFDEWEAIFENHAGGEIRWMESNKAYRLIFLKYFPDIFTRFDIMITILFVTV